MAGALLGGLAMLLQASCGNQEPDPLAPQNFAQVSFVNETSSCLNDGYPLRLEIDGADRGTIAPAGRLTVALTKGLHAIVTRCLDETLRSSMERDFQDDDTVHFTGYCNLCASLIEVKLYNDTPTSCGSGYPIRVLVDGAEVPDPIAPGGSAIVVLSIGEHVFTTLCVDGSPRSSLVKTVDRDHTSVHFSGYCGAC